MGKLANDARLILAKIKSVFISGAHYLHITNSITAVDELSKLATEAKTAITDYSPLIDEMPISDSAKAELKTLISKVMPLLTTAGQITPAITNNIKEAFSAEITSIVHCALTGQKIDPVKIIADIKAFFASEGITI